MAHPIDGGLEYDLGDGVEILIRKMPEDPDGLVWSELQEVIAGLWNYIVAGMRYRAVTFDILDIEDDAQIGWGHIVKWDRDSSSKRTLKRGPQTSSLALTTSANSISGQRNSSLPNLLGRPIEWPVKDSDMTLSFTTSSGGHYSRGQTLDPEAVKNLFVVVLEIVQDGIATEGAEAALGYDSFRHGSLVVLRVVNRPHMLTWGQLATVVLGLIDFMVDHNHYHSWHFTIYIGDPKVEVASGQIARGVGQQDNVTVARRNSGSRSGLRTMQKADQMS